ncbi:hypothetical protein F5877DRAFT_73175, partial [Lentinula edodes]
MSSESPTPNVEMRIAEVGGDGNGLHRVQARDADRSVLEAIDANGILDANACAQFLQRNRLLFGGDSGGEKEGEPVAGGAHGAILVVRFLLVDAAFFLLFFNEAERRSEGSGKCRRVNGAFLLHTSGTGDGSEKKGLGVPGNRIVSFACSEAFYANCGY